MLLLFMLLALIKPALRTRHTRMQFKGRHRPETVEHVPATYYPHSALLPQYPGMWQARMLQRDAALRIPVQALQALGAVCVRKYYQPLSYWERITT